MGRILKRWLPAGAGLGAGLAVMVGAWAGPERVSFPTNYRQNFVNYLQVDRIDRKTVRFMYVDPAALPKAEAGAPVPDGTVLIMEDHKAALDATGNPVTDAEGRFVPTTEIANVFVMEKRAGWGKDYPSETRNGDWDYAWFLPDGQRKADAKFDGCFACHKSRADRDYTFTFAKFLIDRQAAQ